MSRRPTASKQQKKTHSGESAPAHSRRSARAKASVAADSPDENSDISSVDLPATTHDETDNLSADGSFSDHASTGATGEEPALRIEADRTATDALSSIEAAEKILSEAETGTAQDVNTDSQSSLRDELRCLGTTLRDEFKNAISELQSAQAAAINAQSEVLKTLTEMIYQSAASHDIPTETLERAFSGIEERLISRIEAVAVKTVAVAETTPSGRTPESPAPMKLQNSASTVARSWEQIRSEMISKGDVTETPCLNNENQPSEQLHEVTQLTSDRHFRLPEQDPALEIPRAVDPDTLSEDELRDAFCERESFIATLIARIRRQQDLATGQLSPEQLHSLVTDLPDELATQVRHTLKQMEDLARMGELELSLERARIARQINQLEHTRHTLEQNARQLGMELHSDGSIAASTNQPGRKSSSRRWLGKLGFGQ